MKNFPTSNRLITAGAALLGGLLMLRGCEPEKPAPVKKASTHVQDKVTRVVHDEPMIPEPEPEVEPFTVDLRGLVLADGSFNPDFNYVDAVSACVSATEQFTCTRYPGGTSCYFLNPKGPHLSVFIGRTPAGELGPQTGVSVKVGSKSSENTYEANPSDPTETQNQMDMACNDAINRGSTPQPMALLDVSLFTMVLKGSKGPELEAASDQLFEDLSLNGFAPLETGLNTFNLVLDGQQFTVQAQVEPNFLGQYPALRERAPDDLEYQNYSNAFTIRYEIEAEGEFFNNQCSTIEDAMDAIEFKLPCVED